MSSTNAFRSAEEIRRIAGATASRALPIEMAATLPIPRRTDAGVVLIVLYYDVTGTPGNRKADAPSHAMHLDPVTGHVVWFGRTTLDSLEDGVSATRLTGVGVRPDMDVDEYIARQDRLLALSPLVWQAFASGIEDPPPELRDSLREYMAQFRATIKAHAAPFYTAASPEFFNWLLTAIGEDP